MRKSSFFILLIIKLIDIFKFYKSCGRISVGHNCVKATKEADMISGRFSILKVLVLFAVGVFFLLGSGGGGGPSTEKKKEHQPWELSADKRKEYDTLKKKRDYAQKVRDRRYIEYWNEREEKVGLHQAADEESVFNQNLEVGEYKPYGRGRGSNMVWQPRGTDKLHHEISKIDKNIQQIDKQIDDLFKENKHTCFPPDTLVLMEDYSHKAIKDIKIGDRVVVYGIAKDTMETSVVKDITISKNNHFYQINNAVKATAYERFFTGDGWKKIRELQVGDTIFNGNGFEEITSITKEEVDATVYNLTISESHNFFVSHDGKSSMLVHNSSGGHGGGDSGGPGGGK